MSLNKALIRKEYIITRIETEDTELKDFLLTLGCFEGDLITVVSEKKHNIVIALKDGRYSIDRSLAETIIV